MTSWIGPLVASVSFKRIKARLRASSLCAEHAQQLGGESPLSSLMVVKD